MFLALIAAALLAQPGPVGPALPGDPNAMPTMPPQTPRTTQRPSAAPIPTGGDIASSRLERCLSVVRGQPAEALAAADTWLRQARGTDLAEAQHCRGLALVELGRAGEARNAFLAGQAATRTAEPAYAARLGGLAGNAALLAGDTAGALVLLEQARDAAAATGDTQLALGLRLDTVTAQAALGRIAEARASLAAAREAAPINADVLLMSAALARGANDLAKAQRFIEQAGAAAPREPRIALEAGIIAALAGRADAAERSWRSVLDLAPQSPEAASAREYLRQIGAGDAPAAAEPASR